MADIAVAPAEADLSRRKVLLTLACLIGMLFGGPVFVNGAMNLAMAPLSKAFHWSRTEISGALTVMTLCSAFAFPFVGRFVDRLGARRMVLPAVSLLGLATLSVAVVQASLPLFYLAFAALGLLGSTYIAYTRVIARAFARHRGKALALVSVEQSLAGAAMPLILSVFFFQYGWRGPFAAAGAAMLLIGVPLLFLLLRGPEAEGLPASASLAAHGVDAEGMSGAEVRRDWLFWYMVAANTAGFVTLMGLLPHMVPMITANGLPIRTAVAAMATMTLFVAVGQLSAGFLVDRSRSAKLVAPYAVLFAVGIFLISQAKADGGGVPMLFLGVALMGVGGGAHNATSNYFFTRYFGLKAITEVSGLSRALSQVGGAFAPLLAGYIFDKTGSYDRAGLILVGGAVVTTVLFAFMPAYRYAAAKPLDPRLAPAPAPAAPAAQGSPNTITVAAP